LLALGAVEAIVARSPPPTRSKLPEATLEWKVRYLTASNGARSLKLSFCAPLRSPLFNAKQGRRQEDDGITVGPVSTELTKPKCTPEHHHVTGAAEVVAIRIAAAITGWSKVGAISFGAPLRAQSEIQAAKDLTL